MPTGKSRREHGLCPACPKDAKRMVAPPWVCCTSCRAHEVQMLAATHEAKHLAPQPTQVLASVVRKPLPLVPPKPPESSANQMACCRGEFHAIVAYAGGLRMACCGRVLALPKREETA